MLLRGHGQRPVLPGKLTGGKREPGDEADALPRAVVEQLLGVPVGEVVEVLHRHDLGGLLRLLELIDADLGEPDVVNLPFLLEQLELTDKQVFVMMTLFTKDGRPKLVPDCTYPLTGVACVDRVYTDLAVFDMTNGGVRIRETFGIRAEELAVRSGVVGSTTDGRNSGP